MKRVCILVVMLARLATAQDIAPVYRIRCETSRLAPEDFPIRRGETLVIEPTYLRYGAPIDLSAAHLVELRYKPLGATGWVYSATGTVHNATGGVARVRWTSALCASASRYSYEIAVQATDAMLCRAFGTLTLQNSVTAEGDTNAAPVQLTSIDWATVLHNNIGLAPFLSAFDTSDIDTFIGSTEDGTADFYLDTLRVRGAIEGNAGALTNFPGYLARTNDVSPNTLTNFTLGPASATGGELIRTSPNSYMIKFPSLGSGEMSTSNRVYWLLDGVQIGYVDTNGIWLVQGSLHLYEEDLDCNVRLYDGSRYAPSLTPQGHPDTIGMYVRGYQGSYGFAFAHSSNDVALVYAGGIALLSSNAVFTGRGDGLTNVPEHVFNAWRAAPSLPGLTITNNGTLSLRDAGGTLRFSADAATGAATIRGQDTDERYLLATNGLTIVKTNYTVGATGTGVITNVITLVNGQIRSWTP